MAENNFIEMIRILKNEPVTPGQKLDDDKLDENLEKKIQIQKKIQETLNLKIVEKTLDYESMSSRLEYPNKNIPLLETKPEYDNVSVESYSAHSQCSSLTSYSGNRSSAVSDEEIDTDLKINVFDAIQAYEDHTASSREKFINVENGLMAFGWGRWDLYQKKCKFIEISNDLISQMAYSIVFCCLENYKGCPLIQDFICMLISGESTETLCRHQGLSVQFPRGRGNSYEVCQQSAARQLPAISNEDLIPQNSSFHQHLMKTGTRLLLRIRNLFHLNYVILSGNIRELIDSSASLNEFDPFFDWIRESDDVKRPKFYWWNKEADKSLLIGIYKHGYGNLSKIQADPCLCFLKLYGKSQESVESPSAVHIVQIPQIPQLYSVETELNSHFRRLLNFHRKKMFPSVPEEPSIPTNREQIGTHTRKLVPSRHWNAREKRDFYRVLTSFGLEYLRKTWKVDWTKFRHCAKLYRKTDSSLDEYSNEFYKMCLALRNKERYEPGRGQVEAISTECANRCLIRIGIMRELRCHVLTHEKLFERIKLCQPSQEMPGWWKDGVHDYHLLKAVDKKGVTKTLEFIGLSSEFVFFNEITNDCNINNVKIESLKHEILPLIWPKDRVIVDRLMSICNCILTGKWSLFLQKNFFDKFDAQQMVKNNRDQNLGNNSSKTLLENDNVKNCLVDQKVMKNCLVDQKVVKSEMVDIPYKSNFCEYSYAGSEKIEVISSHSGRKLSHADSPELKDIVNWLRNNTDFNVDTNSIRPIRIFYQDKFPSDLLCRLLHTPRSKKRNYNISNLDNLKSQSGEGDQQGKYWPTHSAAPFYPQSLPSQAPSTNILNAFQQQMNIGMLLNSQIQSQDNVNSQANIPQLSMPPSIGNTWPQMMSPQMMSPQMMSPQMMTQLMMNPQMMNPQMMTQLMMSPQFMNPAIMYQMWMSSWMQNQTTTNSSTNSTTNHVNNDEDKDPDLNHN